ncbi:DHH family phosphoesterase [Peloplasma aerotolerans]|jgi:bifunctional oligoribonuclease and PAP phosphatase NrnA|uniref:Bifunctional oligoribonuclease/PAP phosphatase NrnA n=1 Tax=Peloplasma aerotolerans TaxID=3044389 RepID=A0AAW6U6I7_9MOLU|nr:bifunctional oligoribonuclease/PAP phosphatase NrnA [Mariniplasma sp. M4Ah]MDI6452189.1 bifunctional oligoribonuclease/PAP phosphatase NrnA [Mariniplasma sp. M4Ah]
MNIKQKIIKKIEAYDKIIIHRHIRPDMDAIGSQYGLYLTIKENYPNKRVYIVGDVNDMVYLASMDVIPDEYYQDALAIITDVSVSKLISDDRYKLAKEIIIIDHHQNDTDLPDVSIFYKDATFASASEMIIDLIKEYGLRVSPEAATYLYGGMVTDTGRFLYLNNASKTFELAAYITKFNPSYQNFYDYIYTETLQKRQTKNLFSSFDITPNGVAYRKNDVELIEKSGLEFQAISRGMVNQMAGIKEIPIWANFTEDVENNVIVGEFRSRGITIVDIAKKYGGGGHNQACGASLKNWDEVDLVLKDFDERAKDYAKNIK